MNSITYRVPDGYGYIRSGEGRCYFTPVKIAPDQPDGFAMLCQLNGDPNQVYSRYEAIQEVRDYLIKMTEQPSLR